jgi:hypothetical protein
VQRDGFRQSLVAEPKSFVAVGKIFRIGCKFARIILPQPTMLQRKAHIPVEYSLASTIAVGKVLTFSDLYAIGKNERLIPKLSSLNQGYPLAQEIIATNKIRS